MKTLFISLCLTLVFCFSGHAQNRNITWPELKEMQSQQKADLQRVQDQNWKDLLAEQHSEMQLTQSEFDRGVLAEKHRQERKEILILQSDERKHLADLQAKERAVFEHP